MRNYVLAVIVGLAGLTVGAALVVIDRHITGDMPPPAPSTQPGEASAALPPPVVAPDATALPPPLAAAPDKTAAPDAAPAPDAASSAANSPAPPSSAPPSSASTSADNSATPDSAAVALPAPDASASSSPDAAPAASGTAPADAPPTASASDSDLPNVDIAKLPVHPVPSDEPTAPTITLEDRNGKTLKEIKPSPPPSPQVAAAPTGPQSFVASKGANARNATAPALTPPSGAFEGPGQATGGTVLTVAGHSVRLFGVRAPEPRDQCGLGAGDNRSCADVARDALAQRLQHYPNVSCHVPPGQRSTVAAVCLDSSGTDLGGFLVAEGYALADTGQSFDYAGAEGAAHTFRRGLWKSR